MALFRRVLALLTAVCGLIAGLVAVASPAVALTTPGRPSDFNGDGWLDLAVGAPDTTVAGQPFAGAVVVVYSTNGRLDLTRKQRIDQSLSWVPGDPGGGVDFGTDLVPGDFNSDGYSDLAVCTPYDQGLYRVTMTVLFGSANGLNRAYKRGSLSSKCSGWAAADFDRDGYLDLATPMTSMAGSGGLELLYGGPAVATQGFRWDYTGSATGTYRGRPAAGNVNGDRYPDLVFGNVDAGGRTRLHVFLGGPSGIGGQPVQAISSDRADEIAIGDIDGDGYGDMATSYPEGPIGCCAQAGRVRVWYGSATGIDLDRGQTLVHQNTPGIPDALEVGDHFGSDLAIADTNADGRAELAIGAGDEDLGVSRPDAGLVTVIYGGSTGLDFGHILLFHQDTAGLPGAAEEYDRFGSELAFRDFNRDNRAELVIGSDSENGGDGAVHVLRAILSTGLTGDGSVMFGPGTLGLPRPAGAGETMDG